MEAMTTILEPALPTMRGRNTSAILTGTEEVDRDYMLLCLKKSDNHGLPTSREHSVVDEGAPCPIVIPLHDRFQTRHVLGFDCVSFLGPDTGGLVQGSGAFVGEAFGDHSVPKGSQMLGGSVSDSLVTSRHPEDFPFSEAMGHAFEKHDRSVRLVT